MVQYIITVPSCCSCMDVWPRHCKNRTLSRDLFWCSQWNLGDFFPIFEDWDFISVNTQTNYMVMFSFNVMAIVCVIAYLFFIDHKLQIVHYNIFPNLGVYDATFPNLKGPRAPSQNCKMSLHSRGPIHMLPFRSS